MAGLDDELAFKPATELARMISAKDISPVELVELYLDRIGLLDSKLNSYLTVVPEQALCSARRAEDAVLSGNDLPPLHGIPIAIKDLEMTKGIRTTSGSIVFQDRIPNEDSIVVDRMKRAGVIILGKTNTPEFGLIGTTENRLVGHCRNPWNTECTAGGSSGGSAAAVTAGLCAIASGSDGGGSIRIPSSFCGVYGIKPSQGRVPCYANFTGPSVSNQYSQSGPMTRTVRDAALLLQVMAGYDHRDPMCLREKPPNFIAAVDRSIDGLRIGWSDDFGYASVDSQVLDVSSRAVHVYEELGCSLEKSPLVLNPLMDTFAPLYAANAYSDIGYLLRKRPEDLTWYGRYWLEYGSRVSGSDYVQALGRVDNLRSSFTNFFEEYDLLITPTTAVPAFEIGKFPTQIDGTSVDPLWGYTPFTYPVNMVGHPAATVPCGFTSNRLPVGLHIIGRAGGEETVIAASAAFEREKSWIQNRPSVS